MHCGFDVVTKNKEDYADNYRHGVILSLSGLIMLVAVILWAQFYHLITPLHSLYVKRNKTLLYCLLSHGDWRCHVIALILNYCINLMVLVNHKLCWQVNDSLRYNLLLQINLQPSKNEFDYSYNTFDRHVERLFSLIASFCIFLI